jgi:helix-turn-helix protein
MAKQSDFCSVADAAKILDVTPRQVRNMIVGNILPAQQIGGSYVIRRADLAKVPTDRKPGPKPKSTGGR